MLSIKAKREKAGLKLNYVAQRLNVSRITLWQYECGRRNPKIETLQKLAKLYGCTINDFVENS